MSGWKIALQQIESELQIAWPLPPQNQAHEIEQFLAAGLRHHASDDCDLEAAAGITAWVKRAYQSLKSLQENGAGAKADFLQLDAVRREFDEAHLAFKGVMIDEGKTSSLAQERFELRVRTHQQKIEELNQTQSSALNMLLARFHAFASETSAERRSPVYTYLLRRFADARQLRRERRLIVDSGLFDDAWYLQENDDVRSAGVDPAAHYLLTGASEGRDPNPDFSTTAYIRENPDIIFARKNPLVHYLESTCGTEEPTAGIRERRPSGRNPIEAPTGRKGWLLSRLWRRWKAWRKFRAERRAVAASGLFDSEWYLSHYPDVKDAGIDPATHYLLYGAAEGRNPGPQFRTAEYLHEHASVVISGQNPLLHWLSQPGGACQSRAERPGYREVLQASAASLLARIQSRTLAFDNSPEPVVSIVIPVHNQIGATVQCLESIADCVQQNSYEVIVVDDASTGATREILSQIPGLKLIHNEENLGFIDSCNNGATVARGQMLLMLNNDTVVQDQWLDCMVQTFEDFENVGLVGGKLISCNGALQEAGGIVWRDGTACNAGRGADPLHPDFNYARDVDYCSGACIMIPRQLFTELGMFDPVYRPGYYEDVDLAFKVRQAGRRVVYQPAAAVIHLEGTTAGTDLAQGMKAQQVKNQPEFYRRWSNVLGEHEAPGQLTRSGCGRQVNSRALVIDCQVPAPDQDAGSLRMHHLLQMIQAEGYQVTMLPHNLWKSQPYTSALQAKGIKVVHTPFTQSVRQHLEQSGDAYCLVVLSRLDVATANIDDVLKYCPAASVVFDTVDLHFLREKRQAELNAVETSKQTWRETMNREFGVARRCDATIVVSDVEKQLMLATSPALNVHVVSTIYDVHPCNTDFEQRKDLLFVGGFRHAPNVDAVCWLVDSIMPLVWKQAPGLQLHIAGSHPDAQVYSLASNRVQVAGFVRDIAPYFEQCRLSVAPLRFGAGVKGKINQSLAYGVPCIATTIAAEGMDLQHGRDVMLGDSPQEFADQIVRVCHDAELWQRLSHGGQENVQRIFSSATARTHLQKLLASLPASADKV